MTQEHAQHPAREHRWITTYSGQRIDSKNVQAKQINMEDMIRGLAMQTRYLGQISKFYSIAEHSVLVSRIAEFNNDSTEVLEAALFHDGHEYITGDFPSPFKYDVPGLREWESKIEIEFRRALRLPAQDDPIWSKVKKYDLIALHFEASRLMDQDPGWIDFELVAQAPVWSEVRGYDWKEAASIFRSRARQLGRNSF